MSVLLDGAVKQMKRSPSFFLSLIGLAERRFSCSAVVAVAIFVWTDFISLPHEHKEILFVTQAKVLDPKLAVEGISKQLTNTVATWASTGNAACWVVVTASTSCSPLESTWCSSVQTPPPLHLLPFLYNILHYHKEFCMASASVKKMFWGDTFVPKISCSIRERSHGVLIGQATIWVWNESGLFRHVLTLLSASLLRLVAASRRRGNHYSWTEGRRVVILRVESPCSEAWRLD